MKKITLTFLGLLLANFALAQTYSTGMVTFFGGGPTTAYSGQVDITNSTVTVTLVGPSDKWMGLGFNAQNLMDDTGKDVIIFNGTTLTDRSFDGVGVTPPTDTQNWTVQSNDVVSGVRTVVATRNRVASEGSDYTFPFMATPLHLTYARGTSLTVTYHGSGNCGSTTANVTLGAEEFNADSFKMYPNPAKGYFNIELPSLISEADVVVYDISGRKVIETKISLENSRIETSNLHSGSYVVAVKTLNAEGIKTLIIQ